jgi:hydrogenase maturation factor
MKIQTKFPEIGKVSPEFFDEIIYPRLGARREEVLTLPKHGVDIGVFRIGNGKVMAVTTDPIYIVPQYGWEKAAWFAWHILASDVTTSGFPPAYVIVDFNLPMDINEESFAKIWDVFHRESLKYGAAIVTGHTARYTGTDYPMVGGATFMAIGPEEKYLTPEMAKPGDIIIMTKSAAVEATGIFASLFVNTIRNNLGEEILERGQKLFYRMSTVDDALTAVKVGVREEGVTSLHDATECGVIGAVYEVAEASKVGVVLDSDKIPVFPEVEAICGYFGMEPKISISEGTLIITVREEKTDEVLRVLQEKGIEATVIGEILPPEEGRWIIEKDTRKPLVHPRIDPFWKAIKEAFEKKLN